MTDTDSEIYYKCYHCLQFSTNDEKEYLGHGVQNHLYKPLFPNETELECYSLRPQNKPWEKCNITEEEAKERLASWVEKRIREDEERQKKKAEIKEKMNAERQTLMLKA
jgi:CDP-glycerol glycerophosphotransferase (TagB/SpsB family)